MIIETGDRDAARAAHKGLIEDMDKLLTNPGWGRIRDYLQQECDGAFQSMQTAQTGDLMLKASVAFVILSNIRTFPLRASKASSDRLEQMVQEDKEEEVLNRSLTPTRNKP